MSEATYKVPDANMDRLKTELEKLAKKAKATIKRHDQYNGTKQTIVNRVVVLTPEELEKENKKAAKKAAKIKQNPAIV